MTIKNYLKTSTYYEDGDPPVVPPTVPPPPPPPSDKKFTQSDVDKLMADHRKGLQKENQQLVTQLEELRNNANLTQQQKDELEARITTLSQQHLTKEQQIASETEKWKKKHEADTKALNEQATAWKSRFENQIATSHLLAAADKHKAAKASQLVMMLKNQVKVVGNVDDKGQPTGEFVAKITATKIDPKTKQPVTVDVPVEEFVGSMREDADFGNLFLVDGKPGFGGSNVNNPAVNGATDWSKMTPEKYRQLRKEGKLQ